MLIPSSRVRVFACLESIDMRKSFSGLSGVVRNIIQADPLSGHVFVFFNNKRNYVKLLWWDRTGYCIVAKKLVKGTFASVRKQAMNTAELVQVLEGIELTEKKRTCLYEHYPD